GDSEAIGAAGVDNASAAALDRPQPAPQGFAATDGPDAPGPGGLAGEVLDRHHQAADALVLKGAVWVPAQERHGLGERVPCRGATRHKQAALAKVEAARLGARCR